MPDMFSAEERSQIMRAVKGSGTGAEGILWKVLGGFDVVWREQARDLPGTPDFVCDELRLAVFVDGDFWHGRWWFDEGRAPETNRAYWIAKFERNRDRDRTVDRLLRRHGWSCLRFWESDVRRRPETVKRRVKARIVRRKRETHT